MFVEFSFDGITYRQTVRVSTGSPLGPALDNIFVGFHKNDLLSSTEKPEVYFRYGDDTFCLSKSNMESDLFFLSLNNIHPACTFTIEKESSSSSFLDVLVCRIIS